jgi:hypothetical protein
MNFRHLKREFWGLNKMSEEEIRRYASYAFLAAGAISIFMFIRAASDNFSNNVALCLTRGGESCFSTSNPVWTAETLRWLSPIVIILSTIGFASVALINDKFYGIGSAALALFFIITVGLDAEIKDKDAFLNPVKAPTNTVYVPVPSGGGTSSYDQYEIESQLEAARDSACRAANEIQYQWVQLNNQLQQLRFNSDGSFETDRLAQQLQLQVIQLQQQESNLRQQCIG